VRTPGRQRLLHQGAQRGGIKNWTGISSGYEEPQAPDLVICTEHSSAERSIFELTRFIEQNCAEYRIPPTPNEFTVTGGKYSVKILIFRTALPGRVSFSGAAFFLTSALYVYTQINVYIHSYKML
jgi:hypothetical protein